MSIDEGVARNKLAELFSRVEERCQGGAMFVTDTLTFRMENGILLSCPNYTNGGFDQENGVHLDDFQCSADEMMQIHHEVAAALEAGESTEDLEQSPAPR
jgi:hypothetical protein